ncbi:SDR family NAD(P)-dependent oxidoreductase [Actinomycetes bacterium M1A6_2h]
MSPRHPVRAGQHAVVTGGSSGLGLELARHLVRRGVAVTLLARDRAKLAAAVALLEAVDPSVEVYAISVDVADMDALVDAFAPLPRIDVLINSAGIMREGHFDTLSTRDFTDVLDTNVMGAVNTTRAALPRLRTPGGHIVNIASVAGLTGVFGYTSYCTAKHALVGFSHALKYEMDERGIGVHVVCPGEFDSPLVEALDKTRTPQNLAHTLTIPKVDVSRIARETLAGVDRGKFLIVPGRLTRLMVTGQRLAPGISEYVARQRIKSAR